MRDALQRAMEPHLIVVVERLTDRTVRTLTGTDGDGGSSIEAFVLEHHSPVDGGETVD